MPTHERATVATVHPRHWSDWLTPRQVVPKGEGATRPLSIRYPEAILKELDKIAKETNNDRTSTIMHILRWGIAEYKAQRAVERGGEQ